MKYLIYSEKTGEIAGQFIGSEADLIANVPVGHNFLCSDEDPNFKRVVDGNLVSFPQNEVSAIKRKEAARELVEIRNGLLSASDWTQLPDNRLSGEQKTAWATYRQALRDFPQNNPSIQSLDGVIWPPEPSD